MRVFVTGATGFIGSAVVRELLDAGHTVTGLARSDASAEALTAVGAAVHRGSLDDLDGLRAGAAAADGVCHLAFIHDFTDFAANCATDLRAIETIGEQLAGTDKPFVVTSGTPGLGDGRVATEEDSVEPGSFAAIRQPSEIAAVALAERGVRSSVIRLPRSVHGTGDQGFVPQLIAVAREKGLSAYVGEGAARWPAVHRLDAARLYRWALESAPAGAQYHAVGDEALPLRELAEVIARRLDVPTGSVAPEQAVDHFGFLGLVASLDCPASSALTRKQTGWEPVEVGLIADLETGHYFEEV
ncbi:SDR family oxidoreductase [Streptomyces sp. NRRL F-525]|uniref:SDR family oxidoreductase n=1 Tax=Streptomyces sp. NRRL F-525 TaxID=1463861 RepID=UPI000525C28E|nr:SDR family oxidoreductase [Streptomyces sp. NRRL F-525]